MKKYLNFVKTHWLAIGGSIILAIAVLSSLLYKLGSLTGGLATAEIKQQLFSGSWHHIAHNPLNAPLTILQWVFLTLFSHHGQTITRLPSTFFGILALGSIAYILRRWYGLKVAAYGTLLFGLSSWFLHVSRYAGPEVLYLWAVPTLLATHIAWDRHSKRPLATFLAIAVLAILCYIPGMIWLIVVSLGLQPHHLVGGWRQLHSSWQKVVLTLLSSIVVAPLFIALVTTPELLQTWLGLPQTFSDPGEVPRRFAQAISFLVWRGPVHPELWLDRLPILDVFSGFMGLLGLIFYLRHVTAPRTRLLFGIFIVATIFYALGGPVGFSILIPLVYICITAGIGYLLHEWLRVFPRNPLARAVGFALLGFAVGIACLYNTRAYFIAWPHNPKTISTFHNRL